MALVVKDRVQETTTTSGTGTITLAGAVTGFQSFSVIGDANTTYYTIAAGSQFEVGIGTYTLSGTTLSRDIVLESSNAGALVNFSAGTKSVFVTYPAEKSLYLDASNNAIGLGTVATTTTLTNATGLPLTTGVTGTLGATNGGTAQSTYTTGDILYSSATNTLAKLPIGTAGQVLSIAGGIPSWAAAGGSSSLTITDFTATASQTTFTVSYTVGLLEGVYRNGVKLGLADYTATNGTTVVLGTGATLNDLIQVVAFSAVALSNVVSTISFGSTGLTPSTATNGDVSVAGTLAVANGGTGATTLRAATIATLGYTTTATAAGTTTLTATSTATQFFTGSTTQTVVLPVASTMTQGQQFSIHNNSSGSLTVNSSGANLVGTITANTTATITCILTSGTSAASWDFDLTGFTTALPVARGGTGLTALGTANQVLAVNAGATALEFQTAGGGQLQTQIFGSPGTWTNPGTVTRVRVAVTGGGGGGAGFSQARTGGGGGQAGAMVTIPTSPVAITCGGAGNGGSFPGGGNSGGTSSFGAFVSATGGTGAPTGTPGTNGSGTITGPAATILRPQGNYSTNTFLGGESLIASPSPGPQNGVAFSGPGNYGAGREGPGINSQPGFAAGGVGGGVVVEFVG
jgi:hypothetical protein